MSPERLEAFSDGVFAVVITITVLDIKPPHDASLAGLKAQAPLLASYALSFTSIGVYWVNHHHLLRAVKHVEGATLWLNLQLLFWLSFVPLTTNWEGQHFGAMWPTLVYGLVLLAASLSYVPLARNLMRAGGVQSRIADIIGRDPKMVVSTGLYALGILMCLMRPHFSVACYLADACYIAVAMMWFLPNPRLEQALREETVEASKSGK